MVIEFSKLFDRVRNFVSSRSPQLTSLSERTDREHLVQPSSPLSLYFHRLSAACKGLMPPPRLPRSASSSPKKRGNNMDLDILDKKIRRLVSKLKHHNVDLEVFDHRDIQYGEILGKGGEGMVQKCIVKYNELPVDAAVKTVLDCTDDSINITLDEIELLCLAKDTVIDPTLQVYGVAAVPDQKDPDMGHLVIITEAGLMNTLQFYQEHDVPLYVTYDLWARVAGAVHMLHNKKIIHQDLKPENILITAVVRDEMGQIEKVESKIIDLGMGKRVYTEKVVTDDILGTHGYHPPEVLFEDSHDFRADIFMLGVTFCVMMFPPSYLKKELPAFLKQLHTAKKKGYAGMDLFEKYFEPHIEHSQNITPCIKSMLCNMLELQDKRTVTLAECVELCRNEADSVKEIARRLPPMLSPCVNGQDSGISGLGQSISQRLKVGRRTRRCQTNSRTSSGNSQASRGSRVTRASRASRTSSRSQASSISNFSVASVDRPSRKRKVAEAGKQGKRKRRNTASSS